MKKNIILAIFVAFAFSILSCQKTEKFTVQGQFFIDGSKEDFSDTEVFLYKMKNMNPSLTQLMQQTVFKEMDSQMLTKDGKFSFEGSIPEGEPQIYFVGIDPAAPEALFLQGGGSQYDIEMFVAEPGIITLNLFLWERSEVSGTRINDLLSDLFFNRYTKEEALEDSIYEAHKEDPYFNSLTMSEDSVMVAYNKELGDKYYTFMKEYAHKKFAQFFINMAKHCCSEEQLIELEALSRGNLDFSENEDY